MWLRKLAEIQSFSLYVTGTTNRSFFFEKALQDARGTGSGTGKHRLHAAWSQGAGLICQTTLAPPRQTVLYHLFWLEQRSERPRSPRPKTILIESAGPLLDQQYSPDNLYGLSAKKDRFSCWGAAFLIGWRRFFYHALEWPQGTKRRSNIYYVSQTARQGWPIS